MLNTAKKEKHKRSGLKIALYRIMGNDLPPRHKNGQTYRNLKFILTHEKNFAGCRKKWVVNRIIDPRVEQKIIALLKQRKQQYIRIPFNLREYSSCEDKKIHGVNANIIRRLGLTMKLYNQINYFTNNNGARNAALRDGKKIADWVMPFDGNCFFTEDGWQQVTTKLLAQKIKNKCFAVPMYRLTGNRQCLHFQSRRFNKHEPQIIFGKESKEEFNEHFRYGYLSKVELLKRLKFKLEFSRYGPAVAVDEKYKCGYVLRLFSGVSGGETGWVSRQRLREKAIGLMLRRLNREPARRAYLKR